MQNNIKTSYKVNVGLVIGNTKNGPHITRIHDFEANNLQTLQKEIESAYNNKTLESESIFTNYICVVYICEEISTVEIDGKAFTNKKEIDCHYGDFELAKSLIKNNKVKSVGNFFGLHYSDLGKK